MINIYYNLRGICKNIPRFHFHKQPQENIDRFPKHIHWHHGTYHDLVFFKDQIFFIFIRLYSYKSLKLIFWQFK